MCLAFMLCNTLVPLSPDSCSTSHRMALTLSSSSSPFFSPPPTKSKTFFCNPKKPASSSSPSSISIRSSFPPLPPLKTIPFPALDRRASKHTRLRFAKKLKTLLLSKPKHFLPLRVLSRCRPFLNPPPSVSLLSMILRYPSLFTLSHTPSHTSPSLSLLSVSLTPAAASLASSESLLRSRLAESLASKLQRLLMLSPRRRLLLSKLAHLAPDLGLAPDFRSRLSNSHPSRFRTVDTSYGRALELVSWDPSLAIPFPNIPIVNPLQRPIIDRPPKFPRLQLPRGLNVRRRNREYLIRFGELPDVNPYYGVSEAGLEEKRACAVVREVLGMTTERRTLVDHLTHFRKDFGLPNRLRGMMVRHPEMFYVSVKGVRHSVFLVEAYDDRGKLMVEDEMGAVKERLAELVAEGKRMRRERKNGIVELEEDENEDDGDGEDEEDDAWGDLFVAGIGDDWEELMEEEEQGISVEDATGELWIGGAVKTGGESGGSELEIW